MVLSCGQQEDNRDVIKLVRYMPEGHPLRQPALRVIVKMAHSESDIKLIGMAKDHY